MRSNLKSNIYKIAVILILLVAMSMIRMERLLYSSIE